LKNKIAEKTKNQRAAPIAPGKNMRQKNLPKAKLHNVILCNSSNESGVLRT
jgi:hypothetical protein